VWQQQRHFHLLFAQARLQSACELQGAKKMRTKTSKDVLSRGARNVVDAETLKAWIEGPVKRLLPHAAMLCGQSVPHAGGYAAIQKWSLGVPQAYEAAIACAGGNIRSPILARLMRSGGPEFFDSDRDGGPDVDAAWHAGFRLAGWRNLLGFAHREGDGDQTVLTWAAFYNVDAASAANARVLQEGLMPPLHAALSRIHSSSPLPVLVLTPAERAVVLLLLQGKTNKEIGKELGKSGETVKRQLGTLMKRARVRNRTELAHWISSSGAAALLLQESR
jgi:DNA-binding CsgD family transcriptional regulator